MGIRHEWFQTEQHVTVTIFAKGVTADQVEINIEEKKLAATVKVDANTDYTIDIVLQHPVKPETSDYKILKTKVEIKLVKATAVRWSSLESKEDNEERNVRTAVDWNQLEAQLKKEEEEEKPEGDAALNQLFQKIYADGSDETKRAMIKSFQESGGTVLSTNWSEIGNKKTEVKPPDGMEYKTWDQ